MKDFMVITRFGVILFLMMLVGKDPFIVLIDITIE